MVVQQQQRGSSGAAYESLGRALADFSALADAPYEEATKKQLEYEDAVDAGITRVTKTSGLEVWMADVGAEASDFEAAFGDEDRVRWFESCASACERWRGVWRRLANRRETSGDEVGSDEAVRVAEEYRLERETWMLLGSLTKRDLLLTGSVDGVGRTAEDGFSTQAELVEWESVSSETSMRRRCALEWIERGSLERVRYFVDENKELAQGGGGDAAEGHCALLVLAEDDGQRAALAEKLWTKVDALVQASEAELEACRATFFLVRAGLHERAACVDDRRGAHWRAASIRAREFSGYDDDGQRTGNSRIELWRRCCGARSAASSAAYRAAIDSKSAVEDAFRRAAGGGTTRALGVERRIGHAIDLAQRAALYDAALFAALAADDPDHLDDLVRRIDDSNWGDRVWARLLCADVNAARRACGEREELSPQLALDKLMIFESDDDFSAPFRASQASFAAVGIEAVPHLIDGALGEAAANASTPERRRRLLRFGAHLSMAWKAATEPETVESACEARIGEYAEDLAAVQQFHLCAKYSSALDDTSARIESCAACFSQAFAVRDRRKCVTAAQRAFAETEVKSIAVRTASLALDRARQDDESMLRTMEWLSSDFSPCEDGVDAVAHANVLLRSWAALTSPSSPESDEGDDRLCRCAEVLAEKHVHPSSLDAVLSATRDRDGRTAARCLKEYLGWRCLVRALTRLKIWKKRLKACELPAKEYETDDEATTSKKVSNKNRRATTISKRPRPALRGSGRNVPRASMATTPKRQALALLKDDDNDDQQEEGDDPYEALASAAEVARRALRLVLFFPGDRRLLRLKWGAAVRGDDHEDDDDDDEELVWRLDALCATLAGGGLFKTLDVPVAGWLDLGDDKRDEDDLRRRILPRLVIAMASLCYETGNAFVLKNLPSRKFYAHCLGVPRLVAPSARWPGDDDLCLTSHDIHTLLRIVANAALQLARVVPSSSRKSEGADNSIPDVDWDKLLVLPQ